jgi:transcriptional regulator with XRE-family HTH domain|tara:strand:+ start:522 stop:965 length:444 start_codon:yes stop_codon:yes gene_type:complete
VNSNSIGKGIICAPPINIEAIMGILTKRVDAHVGGRIRDRRTVLGLTQEHLANALNISYQQVQKYETGANRVSAGRLYEVSKFLQSEVSFFFEGLDEAVETVPLGHGGKNRSTIELVRNFGAIDNPSIRAAVSSLVKSIARPKLDVI